VKSFFVFSAIFLAVLLGGCAVAEQSVTDVGDQFQQGLQGRGRLVDMDTTQDSFGPEYR